MSRLTEITFAPVDLVGLDKTEGRVAVCVTPDGKLDMAARRANRMSRGAVARWIESEAFGKANPGTVKSFAYPAGMAAEALDVLVLPNRPTALEARKAGAALGKLKGKHALVVSTGSRPRAEELAMGIALRAYNFDAHKSDAEDEAPGAVRVMSNRADAAREAATPLLAVAEGVAMTRDLVS